MTTTYKDVFFRTLSISLFVGLCIGFLEAVITTLKVITSNSLDIAMITDLVKFLTVSAGIFTGFMLVVGLFISPFLFFIFKRLSLDSATIKLWTLRLLWFFALALTFGIWLNLNTERPLLSGPSLLFDTGAVIGAAIFAEFAARIYRSREFGFSSFVARKNRKIAIGWLAILFLSITYGLTHGETLRSSKPNVVLLIVDTLRADRLGSYGYDKDTTPAMDRIAERGVLFEQAYVQWASSLPSHASIMTSLYPYHHGAFPNGKSLNPEVQTLAKILKANGYTNGAFVTNSLVGNQYNFEKGFDSFIDRAQLDFKNTTMIAWLRDLNLVTIWDRFVFNDLFTELAISWMEQNQEGPFFLWLQWLHPHAPYTPPAKFLKKFSKNYHGIADGSMRQIDRIVSKELQLTNSDIEHYEALYDAEVAWSDDYIRQVFEKLSELDLLENTLFIVTSDHGENLYEHGMVYGHYGVYDSSIRIPIILSFPRKLPQGRKIANVVESIDLAPTILEILGIDIPEQFQGNSLLPLIEDDDDWQSVAHSVMFRNDRNFLAFREDDWKIVLDVKQDSIIYELYHIPTDPDELNNRFEDEPDVAALYKQKLNEWIERDFDNPEFVFTPGNFFKEDFDEKTVERLRSLGYIK